VWRWDGRADDGREVASGVYTARLRSGRDISTRSMIIVR